MGNAESQNAEHGFYEDEHSGLVRKHTSRSLRLASKNSRRTRHASSGKLIHRNSEVSNRSSSTPSIPQSLAENGLEPFSQEANLDDFSSPIWSDIGLRPVSYHTDSSVTPSVDSSIVLTAASVQSIEGSEEGQLYMDESTFLVERDSRTHHSATLGSNLLQTASFKKKRSKSADIWREDSFEFSLSDLSQENLTSTEDILCSAEEKDREEISRTEPGNCPKQIDKSQRANSYGDLYSQEDYSGTANGGPKSKFMVYCRNSVPHQQDIKHKRPPVHLEDGPPYSTYNTLPCRKSHCLSEGVAKLQLSHSNSMKGRRAKTTQVSLYNV